MDIDTMLRDLNSKLDTLDARGKKAWVVVFGKLGEKHIDYESRALQDFLQHYFDRFAKLKYTYLSADLDAFLQQATQDSKLPMAHGFALYYYYSCSDWDKFRSHFVQAIKLFPNLKKFWDDIFYKAIEKEAEEEDFLKGRA